MENKDAENLSDENIGLGVDIVDIENMAKILENTPNFSNFTFTDKEKEYCMNHSNRAVEHFATHFAGKEAVLKALGNGFLDGVSPKDVEILHDEKGKPYVVLHNKAKEIANNMNISNIPISLSFTKKEAVSVAIALNNNPSIRSKIDKKLMDPAQQLTKKFKEAKKILEEDF